MTDYPAGARWADEPVALPFPDLDTTTSLATGIVPAPGPRSTGLWEGHPVVEAYYRSAMAGPPSPAIFVEDMGGWHGQGMFLSDSPNWKGPAFGTFLDAEPCLAGPAPWWLRLLSTRGA